MRLEWDRQGADLDPECHSIWEVQGAVTLEEEDLGGGVLVEVAHPKERLAGLEDGVNDCLRETG